MLKFLLLWMICSVAGGLIVAAILFWRAGQMRAFFVNDDTVQIDDIANTRSQQIIYRAFALLFLSYLPAFFAFTALSLGR